jgi:C-terminal processing protease CtpA/Prc
MTVRVLPPLLLFVLLGLHSAVYSSTLEGQVERHTSADDPALKGSSVQTELKGNTDATGAELKADDSNLKNDKPAADQSRNMLQGGTVGGEATIGCLGAYFRQDGMIVTIYPPSDLNRLGVVPGDKILLVDGKKFPGVRKFQRLCVGFPGTVMDLVILHNGQPLSYQVVRIDSRQLTQFGDGFYKRYADKTVTW